MCVTSVFTASNRGLRSSRLVVVVVGGGGVLNQSRVKSSVCVLLCL